MNLDLPFEYDVLARIRSKRQRLFVLLARNSRHTPFVVYEVAPDGSCLHGDYCNLRHEAEQRLIERAGLGVNPYAV